MRLPSVLLPALLVSAAGVSAQPSPLADLKPEVVVNLPGETHHVQGLLVSGDRAFVTSVDRAALKGYLFEYDLKTGKRLRTVELQQGARYHPGGFDGDEDSLWVPVAEYRAASTTVIQRRSVKSLDLISSFEVPDHVGALAVGPDKLYAANWDACKLIDIAKDGKIIRIRDNPTPLRVQDWKYRHGTLIASAVAPPGSGDHAVVWLDPETLRVLKTYPAGTTDRGVPFTNEGLDSRDGTLYLLPEDSPSRLFVFDTLPLANLNRPEREQWLRDLGFGVFIHWNVDVNLGSVISHSLVGADATYVRRYFDILPRYLFPRKFDPREWARLARLAGMRYAVFTAKHHAGFCWWDTKTTPFNILNTPLKRDVVREYVDAFRAEGLAIGFYISPDDFWWFHHNGYPIARPPAPSTTTREIPALRAYVRQQLRELLTNYGMVDVLFIDGPAHGLRELAWEINPEIVVTRGAIETPEQHVPGVPGDALWEACITIGDAWQHKPADSPKSSQKLIETLIEIRAKGGNLLLNVGPRPDGELSQSEEARLRDIALWHFVNGEAINTVRPWVITNEGNIWFTRHKRDGTVYAFVTRSPWKLGERRELTLKSVRATPKTVVGILGQSDEILEYRPDIKPKTEWRQTENGLVISAMTAQRMYDDRRWDKPVVLRITHAEPALDPPRVTTLDATDGTLRGRLESMGDSRALEVGFEYRPRKGLTDLYEKTEPWRALPMKTLSAPGEFSDRLPADLAAPDYEFRAVVKHPVLTLYGAEKPVR
ncbi:MAG: alpha-L-fucosidase [Acidobacteria bacterium]|nr:alpha-L-fucosidase [Acidobacteriota bacterium]